MTKKNPDLEATAAEPTKVPEGEEEAAALPTAPSKPKIDLRKFLAGVTPARRIVRLYGNGGARADLDIIDRQIDEAKARRQQAVLNRLQKERVAAIHTLMSENTMDVTLEGWTGTRSDALAKQLDASGITSIVERNLQQVAAQVVEIDGTNVTDAGMTAAEIFDLFMDLREIPGMEPQIDRLVRVTAEVNADPEQLSVPL